jgi:hypothetical protein
LPLQIRKIDNVEIDNSNRADAGRGQVERSWRPEPARADAQDACRLQPPLSLGGDFGHQKMARVTLQFLSAQLHCVAAFFVNDASIHIAALF